MYIVTSLIRYSNTLDCPTGIGPGRPLSLRLAPSSRYNSSNVYSLLKPMEFQRLNKLPTPRAEIRSLQYHRGLYPDSLPDRRGRKLQKKSTITTFFLKKAEVTTTHAKPERIHDT